MAYNLQDERDLISPLGDPINARYLWRAGPKRIIGAFHGWIGKALERMEHQSQIGTAV